MWYICTDFPLIWGVKVVCSIVYSMHDVILYVHSAWDNGTKLRNALNRPTYFYNFIIQVHIATEVYTVTAYYQLCYTAEYTSQNSYTLIAYNQNLKLWFKTVQTKFLNVFRHFERWADVQYYFAYNILYKCQNCKACNESQSPIATWFPYPEGRPFNKPRQAISIYVII